MKTRRLAAIYSIFVGLSMIGMWMVLYATGQIPELKMEPFGIHMHIAAEITTAILLIVGAFGLLKNRNWGVKTYLLSMGMLLYTLIASPGYSADQGDVGFAVMFIVLIVFAIAFVARSFLNPHEFETSGRTECMSDNR